MASISFRENYSMGVEEFYCSHGSQYRNPHEADLKRVLPKALERWKDSVNFSAVLDMACGSGEVSLILEEWCLKNSIPCSVEASDPFTFEAYEKRMARSCGRFSFEDIDRGVLQDRAFSLIVCCYAMHLVPSSRLFSVSQQMSFISPHLLIITPHKKPDISTAMGWELIDEILIDKIRMRLYRSLHN